MLLNTDSALKANYIFWLCFGNFHDKWNKEKGNLIGVYFDQYIHTTTELALVDTTIIKKKIVDRKL